MQNKINYSDIMDLGFKEEIASDSVFEAQNGYPYGIVTKHLTKKIFLDWCKETKICKLVRTTKSGDVLSEIQNLKIEDVKTIINFYSNDKTF